MSRMSSARKLFYLFLFVAVVWAALRIELLPTDDVRIAKAFLVMSEGNFHYPRPHLQRAHAAYQAGRLPDDQVVDLLILYGMMLRQEGDATGAEEKFQQAMAREPLAAARITALRKLIPAPASPH